MMKNLEELLVEKKRQEEINILRKAEEAERKAVQKYSGYVKFFLQYGFDTERSLKEQGLVVKPYTKDSVVIAALKSTNNYLVARFTDKFFRYTYNSCIQVGQNFYNRREATVERLYRDCIKTFNLYLTTTGKIL